MTQNSGTIIFADKKLAQRIDRVEGLNNAAFVETRAKLFPETGAIWREIAGGFAMFDGVDSPLTQAFALGLFQEVTTDVIEEIEDFFKSCGSAVFLEICPLVDLSFLKLLHERGYAPIEVSNVLYKQIDDVITTQIESEVKARLARQDEKETWANALARGFADGNEEMVEMLSSIFRISFETESTYCFAATLNDELIGGGVVNIHEGIAALAGVAIVPEHRRKGAQNALFNERMNFVREHDCDIATVVTLPGSESQRNAERNGFRVAYTRTKYFKGD